MTMQTLDLAQASDKELLKKLIAGVSEQFRGRAWGRIDLKAHPAGQEILARTPKEQTRFVMTAVLCFKHESYDTTGPVPVSTQLFGGWQFLEVVKTMFRRKLPPFTRDELLELLAVSVAKSKWGLIPCAVRAVEFSELDCARDAELKAGLETILAWLKKIDPDANDRAQIKRIKTLLGQIHPEITCPVQAGEAWSDAALAELKQHADEARSAWLRLLNYGAQANGSNPTAKWLKAAAPVVEAVGFDAFKDAVCRWLPLVDKARTQPLQPFQYYDAHELSQFIAEPNADVLKGLAWLCAVREDHELAEALRTLGMSAYRKLPGIGPRCVRVGNASVTALGAMPGTAGVAQLALLKLKVKGNATQKTIEKALLTAAKRLNMPAEAVEELSVPTYSLTEVGARRETLSEFTAELLINGTHDVALQWRKADGKAQVSIPKAVKDHHAEALKELKQAAKEIAAMLPAQRDRIENLYLAQQQWPLTAWRERYLEHPLIGTIARRLIWRFTRGERSASGIYSAGQIVNAANEAIDWPFCDEAEETQVALWHPLDEATEQVLAWREWLTTHEIRQPFKQAHREIYVLTEAERTTSVYSNRFAAHIIKQHQFNALCGARRWKNQLRLAVDAEVAAPHRLMPRWNMRAEFWVDSIGEEYGVDTNETGTFLYLSTDQVRFYAMDAPLNTGHAGGGGYAATYWRSGEAVREPLPLDQIPPLIFSEIMRAVDLFVAVAS
ncbi:MAG: DUF4132 domain-containing protein, partial [Acidobacteria bacterium]|nr:DUF4132 domain-containing protein [Acidobacteriota bacterium]